MLEYCDTDVGQKVEELRSALERSQAFLADLEEQQHNRYVVGERAPGPSFATTSGDAEASDNGNGDAPEQQKDSAPEAIGGLTKLKSKLTQWFSSRTAAKASGAAAEPAARRLSFSRVNIEFPSQTLAATDIPAPDGGVSTLPQAAPRLQRSVTTARHGPQLQQAPGWTTKRAASFTAAGGRSITCSGAAAAAAATATVLGSHPRLPPHPQVFTEEGIQVPRPASFDVRPNNSLIPTLLGTSVSPQRRRPSILRDTVWSTSPEGRPASWAALQASFRSHPGDDAVPGVETPAASAPRAAGPWVVTEANLSPPLLPPLQIAAAAKSMSQGCVCVSYGGNAPERPPPQPQSLQAPKVRPRSFTLGAYHTPLAGRGAAAGSAQGVAVTHGSAGEDAGGGCRRSGAQHVRAASSWTERGTPGRLTAIADGNLYEEEGQEEERQGDADGLDECGPLLVSYVGGVRDPQRQQRPQPQHHHQWLTQPSPRQHLLTTGALRLAGIPEAERPDRCSGMAARRPSTHRSCDYSTARLFGGAAAQGMGAAPIAAAAAGAGVQAASTVAVPEDRSWGTGRQTWNNEVFIPVEAEGRR